MQMNAKAENSKRPCFVILSNRNIQGDADKRTIMPPKAIPQIDADLCTGCGRCVAACPPRVLWLAVQGPHNWGPKSAELHQPTDCTGGALCKVVCPFGAIEMVKPLR